uniref:Uncharacterized protein n=1 Tax=Canis lupus dingo TaxID=286419 RepID=A0A8C0K9K8_CANLU
MNYFWSLRGGRCNQMVMDVLDPLNQALESRHAVQQLVPASLASGFPYFCSRGSMHAHASGLLGPLPHLSSFTLQPVHSLLPPLGSHGTEVSKKMALRPRVVCFLNRKRRKLRAFPSVGTYFLSEEECKSI